jgi:Rrf2 family protein
MKISRQADYAVRTVVYLSGPSVDGRVPTGVIAEAEDIPHPFLTKVISRLATAGLVVTTRGMGGGVSLLRSPEEITLLRVIEAVDGPILLSPRCVGRYSEPPRPGLGGHYNGRTGPTAKREFKVIRRDQTREWCLPD